MSDRTEEYIDKQKKKLIIAGAILGGVVLVLIIAWIIVTINSPKHMITTDGIDLSGNSVATENKVGTKKDNNSESANEARSETPKEEHGEPQNATIEARGEVPKTGATDDYFLTAVLMGVSVLLATRLVLSKRKLQEVDI